MSAEIPFYKSGNLGWVFLAAGIITWDLAAPETLSAAFRRAHSTKMGSLGIKTAWIVLTAHLFGWLPPQADPIHLSLIQTRRVMHLHHGLRN